MLLRLASGELELLLAPATGGSIAALRWRGIDVLRGGDPASGPLALACFPLVPFSNRIADGRFVADGHTIALPPNFTSAGRAETIHGFGWQSIWTIAESGRTQARLIHDHAGGDWPWPYRAEQQFRLSGDRLTLTLSLTNQGASPMPAGLGLHPYFPRSGAELELNIGGMWENDGQNLPSRWIPCSAPPQWLDSGAIDHCFTGRVGPIIIHWSDHRLTMTPDPALGHTILYVPAGADYFCVEPVSHLTDAVNRREAAADSGLRWLDSGESWSVTTRFALSA